MTIRNTGASTSAYPQSISDAMKNKKLQDELHELSPFLAGNKDREEGFKVPKDYFSAQVAEKATPVVEPSRNWLDELATYLQNLLQPRYALALASVAVLIVAGLFYLNTGDTGRDCPDLLACIPDEMIENYVQSNIDEFDSRLFAPHLTGNRTSSMSELPLEDMEEYLDEVINEMDLEDLETFL